jgi:AraC-like DNA-binding protein
MEKLHPSRSPVSTPLSEVLPQLDFWLSRDGVSKMIVAWPTAKALKRQGLPSHVRITSKKRRGPRKPVRGRRHYQQPRFKLAYWPEDALDENVLPSLACVIRGQVDLNVADYVLHCSSGDWILFPPGVPKQDGSKSHFEGDSAGRQGDLLWLCNGLSVNNELLCWICHSEGQTHQTLDSCSVRHHFLARLFLGFCEEVQGERRPEITLFLLRSLLLMLHDEIKSGHIYHWGKPPRPAEEAELDPIAEALAHIEENLYKHLTIDNVARQVLVSPATLTRNFRKSTGQTFSQYLTAQRIKHAAALLKETDMPVTEICRHVGLKYCQLRLLFKKHHGCSPGQLRNSKN